MILYSPLNLHHAAVELVANRPEVVPGISRAEFPQKLFPVATSFKTKQQNNNTTKPHIAIINNSSSRQEDTTTQNGQIKERASRSEHQYHGQPSLPQRQHTHSMATASWLSNQAVYTTTNIMRNPSPGIFNFANTAVAPSCFYNPATKTTVSMGNPGQTTFSFANTAVGPFFFGNQTFSTTELCPRIQPTAQVIQSQFNIQPTPIHTQLCQPRCQFHSKNVQKGSSQTSQRRRQSRGTYHQATFSLQRKPGSKNRITSLSKHQDESSRPFVL